MKENRADRMPYATFRIGEVTYVPHYRNRHVFVGPGFPRYTQQFYSAAELVSAGAVQEEKHLWERSEYGVVSAAHL